MGTGLCREDEDTWAELTTDTTENLQVDPTDTGENTEAGQQVADDISVIGSDNEKSDDNESTVENEVSRLRGIN